MIDTILTLEKAKAVIAEQDRMIGELTRAHNHLQDTVTKRNEWLDKAKKDAGFSRSISFDDVWAKALAAYNATVKKCTAPNCNENSIGDYSGEGDFACTYHMKKWNKEFDNEYQ